MALLGIRASQVQADLTAAAAKPGWKVLQVQCLAGLYGGAGVTERDRRGYLVDADVRGPKRGPVVVAILAEPRSERDLLALGRGYATLTERRRWS